MSLQIDDDILLAYAEGTLDLAQQAEVEAVLEARPELKAKLEALLQLDQELWATLNALDRIPVPKAQILAGIAQRLPARLLDQGSTMFLDVRMQPQLRIVGGTRVSIQAARCAEMIATLGQAWKLTAVQAAAYAQAIAVYLPEECTDAEVQRIVGYYHLDHEEVQALCSAQHPQYEEVWQRWHTQVTRILRSVNLDWLTDVAVDLEDLTQLALDKLRESIAGYRFNSRFSTWAYTVIVRTAQHVLRKQHAAKRTATVISLYSAMVLTSPADQTTDPEANASARELTALINTILAEHGGPHWVEIFRLWAFEDQRLVDIGRQVGLSPSRVSILLEHMQLLLRQHPALTEWHLWTEEDKSLNKRNAKQAS